MHAPSIALSSRFSDCDETYMVKRMECAHACRVCSWVVDDSLNPPNRKEAWLLTLAQLELTTFGGAAVVASVATSKPKAVAMSALLFSVVCTLWKQESAVVLACTRVQLCRQLV